MSDFDLAIQEFQNLSIEIKKQKLLDLIWKFTHIDDIFVQLEKSVLERNYNDAVLTKVYSIVVKSMEKAEQEWRDEGIKRLNKLHDILEEIHRREAEDLAKEGDPDVRLDEFLNTIE